MTGSESMNIMFICTGNICRSAMAHWLLLKKLEEKGRTDINVYSSGIYAQTGDGPTYEAIEAMKEYDVDLKPHRATNIRQSNIKEMDLILCATNSHKIAVLDLYPELKEKIFTLKEYVGYKKENHNAINLDDPWGYGEDIYRHCASEINECLDLLLNEI